VVHVFFSSANSAIGVWNEKARFTVAENNTTMPFRKIEQNPHASTSYDAGGKDARNRGGSKTSSVLVVVVEMVRVLLLPGSGGTTKKTSVPIMSPRQRG
jgi:hypothetical protein